jgi:multiple sugar transport system permease protein
MSKISSLQLKNSIMEIFIKIFRAVLLFGLCFLILQPLFDKLSVSFMAQPDLFDPTVISIPRNFSVSNYQITLRLLNYWATLFKTVIFFSLSAALQVAACTLTAYGMARYKFPGRNIMFMFVFIVIVVPPQTIMSSLYLNFQFFDIFGIIKLITGKNLNFLGSITGYLLLSATAMGLKSGLYIFLLRQYFRGVPKELEEAAYVDGCGRLYTFGKIMIPDALPMLTSCFLFSFVWQWTDTLYTTLFLTNFRVMPLAISQLTAGFYKYWGSLNAVGSGTGNLLQNPPLAYVQAIIATGTLLVIAPLILLYLVAQKTFVESLSQTGIKM